MIQASSLLYAIYVCLIIAILSGGLVYIFTINKTLATRQLVNEELIDRCDSCYDYFLTNSETFRNTNKEHIDLFGDGLKCEFVKERWGMYSKLMGKAFFRKDTVYKNFLIGQIKSKKDLALYMSDFGEELKISGATKIIGDLKLPKKRYKTAHILGNQNQNNPKIEGKIGVSAQNLPKIVPPKLVYPMNMEEITLETLKKKKGKLLFNGFDKKTLLIHLDQNESLDKIRIKGNFIIKSRDTVFLSEETYIEDVIIQAPKVIIKKGFTGNLQIYADKEVVVESEVKLQYPSCIVISSSGQDAEKKISIAENVEIYGGIVMDGLSFSEKQNNHIQIGENTLIVGDIYCNGIMELKGNIRGSLYTHKLELETKSSKYTDVILNGTINSTEVPKDFVGLPLFMNVAENKFERVKSI